MIAKILETDPPPISSLQPMTPPALDRVVKKCLAKEPEKRWQAASDVCDELKWIAEGGSQVAVGGRNRRKGIRRYAVGRAVIGAWLAWLFCAIAGLAVWNLKPTPPQPVTRTVITLPPGQQLAGLDNGPAVALSPDGTHLAYVARQGGTSSFICGRWIAWRPGPSPARKEPSTLSSLPTANGWGFFAGGKLKKVSVSGERR